MTLQSSLHANSSPSSFNRWTLLGPLLILIACIVTFHQATNFEFTNWDDRTEILTNPYMHPPSASGLVHYWTHGELLLYMPVTWTVWLAIAAISWNPPMPIDPSLFHAANLAVHTANALLVWLILRRLSSSERGSCIAALLFSVHPLQVETVSWMSGLKDLLAAFFSLAAIWFYISIAASQRNHRSFIVKYGVIILCLLLGELSKPSEIVAPLMMFVLDTLLLRRNIKQAAKLCIPLLICCIPLLLVAWGFQHPNLVHLPIWQRPLLAVQTVSFYFTKLFWPMQLVPVYALTPQKLLSDGAAHWLWLAGLAAVVICVASWRKWPELGVGLLLFVVALLPVLGLVEFAYEAQSAVADHYVYLAMFGVALAVCFGFKRLESLKANPAVIAVSIMIAATLAVLSFRQSNYWHDSLTLFEYNEKIVPESWTVHLNIGGASIDKGLWQKGLDESEQALVGIFPTARQIAYQHMGRCQLELGQVNAAVTAYEQAVQLDSDDDVSRTDLAIAYSRANRHRDAIQQLQILATKHPEDQKVRNTLEAEKTQLQ